MKKFLTKATTFCCFQVCSVQPPQIFQVQAKTPTIRPSFQTIILFLMTGVLMTPISRKRIFGLLDYPKTPQFQIGYPTMPSLLSYHQIPRRSFWRTKEFQVKMVIFAYFGSISTIQINSVQGYTKKITFPYSKG